MKKTCTEILEFEVLPIDQLERFRTLGDYEEVSPGHWIVRAAKLPCWKMTMLILIHELAELLATQSAHIPEPNILQFDLMFEREQPGRDDEPGDDRRAPYMRQHSFASGIERLFAAEMGVNWKQYEDAIDDLWNKTKKSPQKKNRKRTSIPRTKAIRKTG